MKKSQFIAEDIINKINRFVLQSGERLPTEIQLAEQYGVSRHTVRQALEDLERINYVEKIQGSGTFIKEHLQRNALLYNSLTRKKFNEISSKIISFEKVKANQEIASLFGISSGSELWSFKRIRIADFQIVQLEHTLIPCYILPEFNEKIASSSIHRYIHQQGLSISYFLTEYSPILLSKEEADILNCKKKTPAMKIKNKGYLDINIVFEITESINIDYTCVYITPYNSDILHHRSKK